MVCVTPSAKAVEQNTGIWKVLRDGHFDGPMNEGAHVRPIKGILAANGTRYRFWEYTWKNGQHGGAAVLVFEQDGHKLSYIGYVETSLQDFRGLVHPEVRGRTLFFPYHDIEIMGVKNSFALSFENGPPRGVTLAKGKKDSH
jgi:hypothetical protein